MYAAIDQPHSDEYRRCITYDAVYPYIFERFVVQMNQDLSGDAVFWRGVSVVISRSLVG